MGGAPMQPGIARTQKGERKPREELKAIDEEEAVEKMPTLELSKESSSYSVSVKEGEDDDI